MQYIKRGISSYSQKYKYYAVAIAMVENPVLYYKIQDNVGQTQLAY